MGAAAGMSSSEEFNSDKGQEEDPAANQQKEQPAIARVALLNLVA
jgi:hypothetical protein